MSTEMLSRVDAAWLHMEQPTNTMVVTALLDFDGAVDMGRLRSTVAERLVERLPRFRDRAVERPLGRPLWVPDETFDLDRHLTRIRVDGGDEAMRRLIGERMSRPLPDDRPLWELTVVERSDGHSSLLARIHHSIADGIALVGVLLSLTDLDAAGTERVPLDVPAPGARSSWLQRVRVASRAPGQVAGALLARGHEALSRAAALTQVAVMRGDTAAPLKGDLSGEKVVAWSEPVDLSVLKSFREDGFSVNDVAVAAAAGAVRTWLAGTGGDPASMTMRATVPMNLRPLDQALALGNEFGLLYLDLPVGEATAAGRLQRSRDAMTRLKESAQAGAARGTLSLLGSLPRGAQRQAVRFFAGKASSVLTNVPGPAFPLHLAGSRIRDVMFWVPQTGDVALGISLLSYDGRIRLGVAADRAVVADPPTIADAFSDEIRALARADLRLRQAARSL